MEFAIGDKVKAIPHGDFHYVAIGEVVGVLIEPKEGLIVEGSTGHRFLINFKNHDIEKVWVINYQGEANK